MQHWSFACPVAKSVKKNRLIGEASAGRARLSASGPLLQQHPHQQRRQREASSERIGTSEHARPLTPPGLGAGRWRVASDSTARASGVTGGGRGGSVGVSEKTVTEDFDSRVVDRALELSMRRKVRVIQLRQYILWGLDWAVLDRMSVEWRGVTCKFSRWWFLGYTGWNSGTVYTTEA